MNHLLNDPFLIWYLMFALLCALVSIPPQGWRAWVIAACWLIVLIVLILAKVAR